MAVRPDPGLKAIAVIVGESVKGKLVFDQTKSSHPVRISGEITGLTHGEHGMHVHEFGDVTSGCSSAGAHFNPHNKNHGGPSDEERHIGDLGNIVANAQGVAKVKIYNKNITLYGDFSILGRSLVVHCYPDDLGKNILEEQSRATGNAGSRVGCGIIALTRRRSGSRGSRGSRKFTKSTSSSRSRSRSRSRRGRSRKRSRGSKKSRSRSRSGSPVSKKRTKSRTRSRESKNSAKYRKTSRAYSRKSRTGSPESKKFKRSPDKVRKLKALSPETLKSNEMGQPNQDIGNQEKPEAEKPSPFTSET